MLSHGLPLAARRQTRIRRPLARLVVNRFAILGLSALIAAAARAETLHYSAEWRFMDAGKVRFAFTPQEAALRLETTGFVSRIYRVVDDYRIRFDAGHCAESSRMLAEEGTRRRETTISYRGLPGKARYREVDLVLNKPVRESEVEVPACVHDVLGALAEVRRKAPGASVALPITNGKRTANVRIEPLGKETIRTPGGVFPTVRYEAFLFSGVVYERKARSYFWLTDDAKRTPVQIQMRLPFPLGTITLKLDNSLEKETLH